VPRFKLTVEYAGTRYSGWQKQVNARTVQGEIERAVAAVTGEARFECQGSGRTDAGVHAMMQVAHLDVRATLAPETLRRRLNDELPPDVNVKAVVLAPRRFHARHAAVRRTYLYQVARRRTAFAKPYVWWVKDPLDLESMRAAAQRFLGMHDFQSFTDEEPGAKSMAVLLDEVTVAEDGELVLIRIGGSHFLWKMVRRMVGVLVEVGRGALLPSAVEAFLHRPSEAPARLTAPASGLFLERVFYDGDDREHPLRAVVPVW
jgi:tRNA pseudouridine38-40 synthase